MTRQTLNREIYRKRSCLCVGLDISPVSLDLNKRIVEETAPYAVAFKPNTAFYEAAGWEGWKCLEETVSYIRTRYPDHFLIADAKRGDIGNTAREYARTFFERMDFDAVTVSPYMGYDSVAPFLEYKNKWVALLALTSNPSALDFQLSRMSDGNPVFRKVIETANSWADRDKMMYVVGATRPDMITQVREAAPDRFLLIPGVGAQGGNVEEVMRYAKTSQGDILINVSRAIVQSTEGPGAAAKAFASSIARFLM
ncbi:MAG: orotidine-5'-phosphate decarboxylase [Bacteroidales bacterium]|nr:orotidine-5'-phosphate decarboxylase [Bacteroidales bacterium]MDD2263983.1 orotidine-5'-phosphate decarboxylase [Bacteroidales bacterium]MDD2831217.1 orotidine-5'-phosphate decarboxylase [Bacteroidales bacterium]MDD3208670.1 orotidine-5'-phosphate decarboxylase [Bacteroidales bacterium]MDD3697233.1 orotidine-5'-phosphate decarboxylase [Bacteroidales bacterium]